MSTPRVRTISVLSPAAALLPALWTVLCVALLAMPSCTKATEGTPVIDEAEVEALAVRAPRAMRVVSSFGGAHRAMVVDGNVWFQTFANRVLMLESETGTLISDVELAPRGTSGPAGDLVVNGNSLFVVLERDAVVELDVHQPRLPTLRARWTPTELGIEPMKLSLVDGQVLVSGDGGVVRLSEAAAAGTSFDEKGRPIAPVPPRRLLDGMTVGTVVAADGGPVACVGRRILRLETGEYLGAASMLAPMPDEFGGGYAFALQASEGAEVGILGTNFRERSSSALRGTVRSLRIFERRFLAVTEFEIATWKLETKPGPDAVEHEAGTQLGTPTFIPVKGARDAWCVRPNRYAVAGTFGRSLYRLLPEGDKPGDSFHWSERMPGRLDVAVSDRRRTLAAGVEGNWMYLIGDKAELVERPLTEADPQNARAEVAWGSASCDEARQVVTFRVGDRALSYMPSRTGLVSTLAAADGKIWVGHDHGIDIVGYDATAGELVSEARITLAGPMIAIYPNRLGGGVNYVARLDGFGVIRPIGIDQAPSATPGTVSAFGIGAAAQQGAKNP